MSEIKVVKLLCLFIYLSQLTCYRFILSARHKWMKKIAFYFTIKGPTLYSIYTQFRLIIQNVL